MNSNAKQESGHTNSTEHTKTPWRIIDVAFYQAGMKWVAYVFAGRDLVARFYGETEEEATNAANAAIKAVNSHEALVEALTKIAEDDGRDPDDGSFDEWSEAHAFKRARDLAKETLARLATQPA